MKYSTIASRHSVRAYAERQIEAAKADALKALASELSTRGGVSIAVVLDEPQAFGKSIMARYGKFSGVRNYFVLAGPRTPDTEEKLGYYGEHLVLKAQELGLNTCWVGLSYSKSHVGAEIPAGYKIYAVIAFGYGATQGVQSKSKRADQIDPNVENEPEWYRRGVDYALLAPTAVNQQKFRFRHCGGTKVEARRGLGFFSKMDLGIVKYHFELGAQPEKVEWV